MKILFVTHFFGGHGGGIELVAEQIASGLIRRGVTVRWAATELAAESPKGKPGLTLIGMRGSNILEQKLGLPFPVWTLESFRRLRDEVRTADVVHVHDGIYLGSHLASRYARALGKPVLLTQHIGDIPFPDVVRRLAVKAANGILTRRQIRHSDAIVFYSAVVAEFFRSTVPAGRSHFILNGVDHRLFHPEVTSGARLRGRLGLNASRPVFLFVGRFVAKKGLARLRQAAAALPHIQWLLVGKGPIDPTSWRLSQVRVVGHVNPTELPDLYRAADLTVLPSVGEGFPLVVQESMACGTPCLVSDETRRGCPEVEDLLLSAGSQATEFVDACKRANVSFGTLRALGDSGAIRAQQVWSWERCVNEYLHLYEMLLKKGSFPPARAFPDGISRE